MHAQDHQTSLASITSPRIDLVAVDLDGTLLDPNKNVCPRAAEAIMDLPRRGVRVVIASARPPRSVRHIYQCLKLDTWQINYNGALIWDEPARRAVHHAPVDFQTARRLIERARARHPDVLVTCEILDRWFTDRHDQTYTTATGRLFPPDVVAPIDQFCNQPITKVMFLGPPAMIDDLTDLQRDEPGVNLVRGDPDLIQIMDCSASKASALKIVAERYGVAMASVLAIGDAANDIPMLQAAGVAVAMGNASDDVRAAADWIAPANDDFGVHAALLHFGLC